MDPTATMLDFYIQPKGHRQLAKERLNRQREDMFSWRADRATTSFHPVTGERCRIVRGYDPTPKQVYVPGSQREAGAMERARCKKEASWMAAAAAGQDRRRVWRITGFRFERNHFRTSDDPSSPYHFVNKVKLEAENKRLLRTGKVREPYEPYYHDDITICEPTQVPGSEVTSYAVTCNREEGEVREIAASRTATKGGDNNNTNNSNWCDVLGPSVARKQRSVQLAENMYQDLVHRQATLTGTADGSPESLKVRLPTSELAYSLRPSFVAKHSSTMNGGSRYSSTINPQRRADGTTAAGSTTDRGDSSILPPLLSTTSATRSVGPMDNGNNSTTGRQTNNGAGSAPASRRASTKGMTVSAGDTVDGHRLPAESKEMRLYAVRLRRTVGDQDTSMVRRVEPPRSGVPVQLPEAWLSPMTFEPSK